MDVVPQREVEPFSLSRHDVRCEESAGTAQEGRSGRIPRRVERTLSVSNNRGVEDLEGGPRYVQQRCEVYEITL